MKEKRDIKYYAFESELDHDAIERAEQPYARVYRFDTKAELDEWMTRTGKPRGSVSSDEAKRYMWMTMRRANVIHFEDEVERLFMDNSTLDHVYDAYHSWQRCLAGDTPEPPEDVAWIK